MRKMTRLLSLLSLMSALSCCAGVPSQEAGNTAPVRELATPQAHPPKTFVASCEQPVDLSKSTGVAREIATLWAKDRASLADCRYKHGALVNFYRKRDAGLSARSLP